ncbi:MAG: hypothetical protein VB030_04470 [Eubacterium aggregans]|uniref:hypothetical protein n=1 Tax=Eubacterium aggregans TaxID=81409 RepID=UPI002B20C342|nr:hypothetical protein [Eubacterium aggregans]MEA5073411.1 hypothetical protein [Eubacterium aggregans]
MSKIHYHQFLEKLIEMTNNHEINWKPIPNDETTIMELTGDSYERVCYWRSFYFEHQNANIVVYSVRAAQGIPTVRVSSLLKDPNFQPIEFDRNEFGSACSKLQFSILDIFPTPEDIIESFPD